MEHVVAHFPTQGEIRRFRNSEKCRKLIRLNFRYVSANRIRQETCKRKMVDRLYVSAEFPLAETNKVVSIAFPKAVSFGNFDFSFLVNIHIWVVYTIRGA